jgi:transposase-like protein
MSQKRKTKEEIVAEYLTGNYTYRELGLKYDIPFRSICDWGYCFNHRHLKRFEY